MADTQTAKYGAVKPEVGASNNTWGTKQNAAFDIFDSALAGTPAAIASAATTDLTAILVPTAIISGSVAITSFGVGVIGFIRKLIFTGAPLLTNSANLVLPGAVNLQIAAGDTIEVICTAASTWKLFSHKPFAVAASAVPVGAISDYVGTAAPALWLLCFGQAVSRTTYAALFAITGTVYGVGDGSTTFNLPDLRGRVVAGKDDMGGSSANRLTNPATTIGGIDGDILGGTGGQEAHANVLAENAPHTHTGTTGNGSTNHTHSATTSTFASGSGSHPVQGSNTLNGGTITIDGASGSLHTHSFTTASSGSGTAHNVVQPTIILNKMIYAGV